MKQSGIIYVYAPRDRVKRQSSSPTRSGWRGKIALGFIALSLGGILGPLSPMFRMEGAYAFLRLNNVAMKQFNNVAKPDRPLPKSVPVVFAPLMTPDGASIEPVDREFTLVVPKVGINAAVIPSVNPANPGQYMEALKRGIAHASTSFFPDEDGTVYLFSHSTNYDWFVRDLNAVFYLLKNLSDGDLMVIFYKGRQYTYRLREKRITKPSEVSYLVPQPGKKTLILQTCWPPGSTTERLLLFADLIEEQESQI